MVVAHFVIPAPKGFKQHIRETYQGVMHDKKPDGDNLEKFLNDSLTGVVWQDDARISWLVRSKTYTSAKEGYTQLFVKELESGVTNLEQIISLVQENINPEAL